MPNLWTIAELSDRVEAALAAGYAGPPTGRVRAVPDQRTIRYYTTLGLLDRPAAMRGRTALYSGRHLEQLVAIKRLQARGLSLAAVQAKLAEVSAAGLSKLARLPAAITVAEPAPASVTAPVPRAAARFWASAAEEPAEEPAEEAAEEAAEDDADRAAADTAPDANGAASAAAVGAVGLAAETGRVTAALTVSPSSAVAALPRATPSLRIELAPGVVLELATAHTPSQTDLAALRARSEGLLALLSAHPRLRPTVTPTEGKSP